RSVNQPSHYTFKDGIWYGETPLDEASGTEAIFFADPDDPDEKTLCYILDTHYYVFTVDLWTISDCKSSGSDEDMKWTVETDWRTMTSGNIKRDETRCQDKLSMSVSFTFEAAAWPYRVNEEYYDGDYDSEAGGTWSGVLWLKVFDEPTQYPDKNNVLIDLVGKEGWYGLGTAYLEPSHGEKTFFGYQYVGDDEDLTGNKIEQLGTQRKGSLGMTARPGLMGHEQVKYSLGGLVESRWFDDMRPIDVGMQYRVVAKVLVDHGFVIHSPYDTQTGLPVGHYLGITQEYPNGNIFENIYDWFGRRWGEAKGVGGFFGDIISALMTVLMILVLIIPILIIAFIVLYVIGKFRRGKG
ncbi:MAG: hypothetical protein HWN68_16550, partial [Desulfobacterales bacterium]|nr:hypothetical protein [Desulfobacterales bacterium]